MLLAAEEALGRVELPSGIAHIATAATPPLAEFGYGHLRTHFNLTAQRPLLVILAEFNQLRFPCPPELRKPVHEEH